jgi:Uma2 family endonuclease
MPTAVPETPVQIVAQNPPRKRWTRSECEVAEAAGLFDQERLELIDGELISKMGKKRPHVNSDSRLFAWLIRVFGEDNVNFEAPIDVSPEDNPTNEPVPDQIVLKPSYTGFLSDMPQPEDLALVVEVADTTLTFDLTVKAALYARAGIVEYWVLDFSGRRLVVHRDPQDGRYRSIVAYSEQESVAPLAAPDSAFPVGRAFRRK